MRTIVLNEDFKAVSRPECHARGLIPFCLENPKLRIERHIGLFTNLLPVGIDQGNYWLDIPACFEVLIAWIEEALSLSSYGMPTSSFKLVIMGATPQFSEIWKALKFAAATQEARLRHCRITRTRLTPKPYNPNYEDSWSLPRGFSQAVRDIM
jgi:hypothetical protein